MMIPLLRLLAPLLLALLLTQVAGSTELPHGVVGLLAPGSVRSRPQIINTAEKSALGRLSDPRLEKLDSRLRKRLTDISRDPADQGPGNSASGASSLLSIQVSGRKLNLSELTAVVRELKGSITGSNRAGTRIQILLPEANLARLAGISS
ncbi:MAG: hypothetical protein JXR89_00655, partial [Deltaproteobacteria bacterium]|nr:hypothetical protein [Deltaproteobacteria bacterium]